ncbi:MAG: hypothetical protein RL341_2588 [Pseudomonadota bacterium]
MRSTTSTSQSNGPATISDPIYKAQALLDALELLATSSAGLFQFVGMHVPTLVVDVANRQCFVRMGESPLAGHGGDMVSARRLTELPIWVDRAQIVPLDALLLEMHERAAPAKWGRDCTYRLTRMPPLRSDHRFKFNARVAALCMSKPMTFGELQLLAGSTADQVRAFLRECDAAGCLTISAIRNTAAQKHDTEVPRGIWAKIQARINVHAGPDLLITH